MAGVMTSRSAIVAEARRWLGTRWQHQGRTLGHGVDCIGLVLEVARACGLTDLSISEYARRGGGGLLHAGLIEHMQPVGLESIQPADVLLMRFDGQPQHVALVTDHPAGLGVIHAYLQARKVVEHRLDDIWRGRTLAAFAFKGLQ
jgi:NlpC/P60 family putative phage cell wall peptidase